MIFWLKMAFILSYEVENIYISLVAKQRMEYEYFSFHFEIEDIFNKNIGILFLLYTANLTNSGNFNNHKLTLISSSVLWQQTSSYARVIPNKMLLI